MATVWTFAIVLVVTGSLVLWGENALGIIRHYNCEFEYPFKLACSQVTPAVLHHSLLDRITALEIEVNNLVKEKSCKYDYSELELNLLKAATVQVQRSNVLQ